MDSSGRGLDVETVDVEKPGVERFSPARPLDDRADRWLKAGLEAVMPDLRLKALFAARPDVFREAEHLVVPVDGAGRPLGALGSKWMRTREGTRFLHIGVQFVAGHSRRGRAFSVSWSALLDDLRAGGHFPHVSALKTYNPVAYCAMRAYGRLPGAVMFPEVDPARHDPDAARLAADVAAALAPDSAYDPASGCITGIGNPRDLYVSRPECDDRAVNRYFARHTAPGDRILCLVDVRSDATERAILDAFARRRAAGSPAEPVAPQPVAPQPVVGV